MAQITLKGNPVKTNGELPAVGDTLTATTTDSLVAGGYGVVGAQPYDVTWSFLVPVAIPLLLLRADLRRIVREAGPTLLAFVLGAVGTVVGTIVAFHVVPLGAEGWRLAAIFSATYVGGSMNYAAAAESVGLQSGDLLTAGVAADNLAMALYFLVIVWALQSRQVAEQKALFAGMAKETAHQIGTPLTSLLGWNELLKEQALNPKITTEIEKDIGRLQTITERFSQIGSMPRLELHDIVEETKNAFEYLQARSSKLVRFRFHSEVESLPVLLNKSLYHWTIENLVKNGIDAMKGKGEISVDIRPANSYVNILVSDTGHGIPRKLFQEIFNPGYTTKKRGWGLGLSLVKRIVEEYHEGKIKVLSSGKEGTVMQLSLRIEK